MSDLRVSFGAIDSGEGRAALDARSFRRAAVTLATGRVPKHTVRQPVYVVAPQPRRAWVAPVAVAVMVVAAILAVLLVWLR